MASLCIEVGDELLRDFRSFVIARHGKLRGEMRPELEAALHRHMREQANEVA